MLIYIPTNHLRAALLFAPTNDIRHYLNGVLVDASPGRDDGRLVACDGHTMMVARLGADSIERQCSEEAEEPFSCIIPRDVVARIVATVGKSTLHAALRIDEHCTLIHGGTSEQFTPLDGRYPDYLRVIPRQCSGVVAQFNADYVARCAKAAKIYGRRFSPAWEHNGSGSAIVHNIDNDVCAVVMPLGAEFTPGAPEWLLARPVVDQPEREPETVAAEA